MKNILFNVLFLLASYVSCGVTVTSSTRISLLTCGCGNEVYSMYGHTALRVKDTAQSMDVVVNYGVFSMANDDFMYKFLKGETDYMVVACGFESFMDEYSYDGRSVYENVLNLPDSCKYELMKFLEWNLAPENRVYRYKYFSDNCATRVRDLLEEHCDIRWNNTTKRLPMPGQVEHAGVVNDFWKPGNAYSFRNMISVYQQKLPWIDFGIHVPMALPSDRDMDYRSVMFLPDFLMDAVQNAEVMDNGVAKPLSRPHEVLLSFKPAVDDTPSWARPHSCILAVFSLLVVTTVLGFLRGRLRLLTDVVLLVATGLMGLLVFYLAFFSVHESLSPNFNLWWAFPVNFLAALLVIPCKRCFSWYSYFIIVLYGTFFVCLPFLGQSISVYYVLLPLVLFGRQVLRYLLKRNEIVA